MMKYMYPRNFSSFW